MSQGNRIEVSFKREASWGVAPAASYDPIILTGGSFGKTPDSIRSDSIRSDAQAAEALIVGDTAETSLDFEFRAGQTDELIRGILRSNTAFEANPAEIASVAVTADGYEKTGAFGDVDVGDWIYAKGYTDAGNNGWKKVSSADDDNVEVIGGLVVEAAGADKIINRTSNMVNGIDDPSYTVQESFEDLTNRWQLLTGGKLNTFSMSIESGSIIVCTAGITGKSIALPTATNSAKVAVNKPSTNKILAEVDGFDGYWIDSAKTAYGLVAAGFSISLEQTPETQLGTTEKQGITPGSFEMTGNMTVYASAGTWPLLEDFYSFNKRSHAFAIVDRSGNRYHFEFPAVLLSGEGGEIPGRDGQKQFAFDWSAEPGTVGAAQKTVSISRITA